MVVPGGRATGRNSQGQNGKEWVCGSPQKQHIKLHVVGTKRRSKATEEIREDRPVTGFLDGCSGDGWFGDGQEYRGAIGETQQQHENQPLNQSSQMALSEHLLPRRTAPD